MRQKKPMKKEENKSNIPTTPQRSFGADILGGVLQGFTFGSGSAVAHNLFRPIQIEKKKDCKEILQLYESLCKDKINYSFEENNQCKNVWDEIKKYC